MIDLGIEHLSEVELIGRGGFSTVYAATDTRFDRRVAVKLLGKLHTDKDRQRFERECKIMGRLSSHPSVVTVYDAGYSADGSPYLVMELVTGGSMADRLQKEGPLPWRRAVEYLIPIADALGHGHTQGILHRDVKPENILMAGDQPRLTDFGIASARDSTGATSTNITASWLHTAPETFANTRDERSDLYSLMSTLHTLIQGNAPFWAPTDESLSPLMYRLLHQPPPPLPAHLAPPAVVELLQRGLAKEPSQRPQNADELIREMRRVLDNPGGSTSTANPTQIVPPMGQPAGGPSGAGWPAGGTGTGVGTGYPGGGAAPATYAGSAGAPYQAVLTPPGGHTGGTSDHRPPPPQSFSGPRPDTGPGSDPRPAPPAGFSGPRPDTGPRPAPQGFPPQGFTAPPAPAAAPAPGRQGFTASDGRFGAGPVGPVPPATISQPVGWNSTTGYGQPSRGGLAGSRLALIVGIGVFLVGAVIIAAVIAANRSGNTTGTSGGGDSGGGSTRPISYTSSDWVRSLAVLGDGRLATTSDNGEISVWDPASASSTPATVFRGHTDWARVVIPLTDGRIASSADDYTVRVWDPANPAAPPVVFANLPDWPYAMAQIPDGRVAVAAANQVLFYHLDNPTAPPEIYTNVVDYIQAMVVLDDGRLAVSGYGGKVSIFNPADLASLPLTIQYDGGDSYALAKLPDGRLAVANGYTVNVFDPVNSANTPLTFAGHTANVVALVALPDGRVASGGEDGTVQVWDPDTSIASPVIYRGHEGTVYGLASFPDGRVASGGDDSTVQIWDPDSL
ncbi:MAG: protein kinase [Acidimicrobiales bacterium]